MLALTWALACAPVPVDPTGRPFDAVEVDDPSAAAPAPPPARRPDLSTMSLSTLPPIPEPPSPEALAQADLELAEEAVPSPAVAEPAPAAISPSAVDLNWDPAMPTRDEAFGIRLVGTMIDAQPPNAVLRLPNGDKALVEAGEMLDDAGLLVLAIGDKVVKLVKVTKHGWYARVETAVLHSNPRGPAREVTPAPDAAAPPEPDGP